MSYKIVKYGDYRERRNFSKIRNTYELKDLLEVQKKSYKWFLDTGIKEVFEDLFPVENFSGTLSLEFGDYHFDEPRYSIKESKDRESTYAAPLRVEVRLFNRESGEVKEQEIFMGDMPMMTDSGTFVINGAERVIVSQLVRSPSVYYNREIDKSGRELITSQIIPTRGTWLEFETDARDVLYVRIDRTRKVTLTTLLRAFGLSSDEDIFKMFGEDEYLKNTIAKDSTKNTDEALIEIYEKLRPGEPVTLDSSKNQIITRFFDEFRYDLARVGRYKFNRKLNVLDRMLDQVLAEDVTNNGEVVLEKGTKITKANIDVLKEALANGFGLKEVKVNEELDQYNKVQIVKIVNPNDKKKKIDVIGNDQSIDVKRLTISDVYASVSYYLNLLQGVGNFDEIDHLGNRRIRQVGELLQNQFRIGVSRMERVVRERMTTQEMEEVTPKTLINIRPVTAAMKEFFGSSQLSQFMDQTNPIAELTNKRRLSALGPGGLSRDRAGVEVRDVNSSHYGRICPIESPEGPNIGLITSLASYAKIDEYGFIMTPYRKVVNCQITDDVHYLTADEELDYIISQSTVDTDESNKITSELVNARFRGENILAKPEQVDYIDVSPQQVVSVTTSCIPFLEHDDATRASMGANMQRQAMPLIKTEAPYVGTGVEFIAAKDSGVEVIAKNDGIVEYVDAKKVVVKTKEGKDTYKLANFELANSSICSHQRPIVHVGDKVKADKTILADGNSTDKGELALGKNMTVAFMTFNGYNYEDAVILNENLVKDDKYTSLHLEDYEMQCRETKLGPEEITRDIPNVSEEARRNLDENGIITIGTEVKEGDILVGKVTPKGMAELTSEEKLLHAIFGEKTREVRDTSLRVPHGGDGIVHDIKIYSRKDNDELPAGVSKVIRVYIIQKRKIQVGDKMSGRHGNKGVISLILPQEDMPYLPDGTPVDIMLNPQGVPSRMNFGQILEIHMGMACKKLGVHIATPVFDGAHIDDIKAMMKEAGMDEDGKTVLYDGRTGEPFDHRIAVGVMYMIKLHHMVDDKLHARSTGPYSLVTQQPLGGKAQFGGQRFGEMEVWALYAYGAAHTLQEILTVKSDDVIGRVKVYESIIKGQEINQAGVPESFRVLMKEFQALGLDISIINDDGETLQLKEIEEAEDRDDNNSSIEEFENSPVTEAVSEPDGEEKPYDDGDDEFEDEEKEFEEDYEDFMNDEFNEDEDFEEGADL
ncbi:MAG: DNA-directed RNA polymerase subunit beta [Bacilli bacterium]|nr:DNA-directed RNA polymerase subunit beta [Mycoplasmatota bacterium]MDD6941147.1 DNA-directed RNA polymerase subunit beta [bacterium]MDY2697168.1 DNA-directed RNA polymerase subunit beta [Bacilli bacterium]MDY5993222.1 DNA-directed RNA polymerase subunit beta [Bacilli bacterium]MEE0014643.1 DNA-directed RNA polymerase subunit beta [Bacilli bacterium]